MLPSPENKFLKLLEPEEIELAAMQIKREAKTIATLNGSFDLLHAGHLLMMHEAALQADVLIVALNSDASIRKYKSAARPIIPLEYRLQMVSALTMVDYVTWFDETDPCSLLSKIKPHVHVNGAEYGMNCIEAEIVKKNGGRIHIVDLVPGLSTTYLIEKVKVLCG